MFSKVDFQEIATGITKKPRPRSKNREYLLTTKARYGYFCYGKKEKRRITLQNRKEELFWDVSRRTLCYRKNGKEPDCVAKSERGAVWGLITEKPLLQRREKKQNCVAKTGRSKSNYFFRFVPVRNSQTHKQFSQTDGRCQSSVIYLSSSHTY